MVTMMQKYMGFTASPPMHLMEGSPSDPFLPDAQPLSPSPATVPTQHVQSFLHTQVMLLTRSERTCLSSFWLFMVADFLDIYSYHKLVVTPCEKPY